MGRPSSSVTSSSTGGSVDSACSESSSVVVAVVDADDDVAFADAERGIDGFGQSAADAGRRFQAIDHHFDVVPHLAIEREIVGERNDLPSTRARTKPCLRRSSNRSLYSPFWPRMTGASTANCVLGRQSP